MAIIEVNNVTKKFKLGHLSNLKDAARAFLGSLMGHGSSMRKTINALDDVSFEVGMGEIVGIIGSNGAGKSTLLKLISGITVPSEGTINVHGSIAPLIEVGAGLHPELTGRENIYLNGSILGVSRSEIQRKLDEIVGFAELEEFIDTPVKRYSSGMKIRLGFSIATSVDADILILDEVLAVGDLAFQRKCFDRMEEIIKRQGKTVLLVSHSIRKVERICSRVLLLDRGKILIDSDPTHACNIFYDRSNQKILQHYSSSDGHQSNYIESSGEIELEDISIYQGDGRVESNEVNMHTSVCIEIRFSVKESLRAPEIVLGFHTTDFVYVASTSSISVPNRPNFDVGSHCIKCILKDMMLTPGVYGIRLAFLDEHRRMIWYGENLRIFKVNGGATAPTELPHLGLVDLPFQWFFSDFVQPSTCLNVETDERQ
jgi:ABC-type polysaccharide/polyol phosphate transport system ATPase subunit